MVIKYKSLYSDQITHLRSLHVLSTSYTKMKGMAIGGHNAKTISDLSSLTKITYVLTYWKPNSGNFVKFSISVVMTTYRVTTGWS